jgi:hypothetical protein
VLYEELHCIIEDLMENSVDVLCNDKKEILKNDVNEKIQLVL